MSSEKKFRVVNQTLGEQPKIGPVPANQIFPWLVIAIVCIFIVYWVLNLGWLATLFTCFWGWATWCFVSTSKSFLGKFVGTPRISRGYMPFISLINYSAVNEESKKSQHIRIKKRKNSALRSRAGDASPRR